jgi:hypothetical protein
MKISVFRLSFAGTCLGLVFASVQLNEAVADGTETLGPPSISIANGTGIVAAGTGLETQPGSINFSVPEGAAIRQVLLYWSGEFRTSSDSKIKVNTFEVTGDLIGGPSNFYSDVKVETFRADITGLGVVSSGPNSLLLDDLNFDKLKSGAGVLVIYDDGSSPADIQLRDGQDLAFVNFDPPLDTTVAQTFVFPAAGLDRVADLVFFAASVGTDRPNAIIVAINGSITEFVNPLGAFDGSQWDTFSAQITIPSGATMVTVQALSKSDGSANLPASLNWLAAGFSISPDEQGGEGCTPGYWRNHLEAWPPTGLSPSDDFDTTFGVDFFDPDITLDDAVNLGGGGLKKLARHGTAALLNASHPDVNYPLSTAEVIAAVQSGDVDDLLAFNELSPECPAN